VKEKGDGGLRRLIQSSTFELARGQPAQAAGEEEKDLGEDLQQHLEALFFFG